MNSKEFSLKIEALVKEKKIPYMDAVIDYCKNNDIDVGTINSMVNKSLKEKKLVGQMDIVDIQELYGKN